MTQRVRRHRSSLALGLATLVVATVWFWLLPQQQIPPASAQGVGIYSRQLCSSLTGQVQGGTFCFEGASNTLKFWNGSAWVSQGFGGPSFANLLDYGCVGDNATANDTCITNALAALTTAGDSGTVGGMIYVPPGIYRHTNTITWPNKDFVIFGASDLVSVFRYTGTATGNQINSDGSTIPNKFRDVAFTSINTSGNLWNIDGGGRVIFEDVRFRADSGNPILLRLTGASLTATQQTTLRNVYVNCNSLATVGIQLAGKSLPGVATTNIVGGRINQCTQGAGVALDVSTAEGLQVYGTNLEGNIIGVRLDGARAITLDGLWFESNTTSDVQIRSTSISTVGVDIRNSRWASSSNPTGIDILAPGVTTRGVRVVHNSFTTASTIAAVRIAAGVQDTIVAFNTFSNDPDVRDLGTRTMKFGNVGPGSIATPVQTNSDAGLSLFATATASNGLPGSAKVQINSSAVGQTIPLAVSNVGNPTLSNRVGIDFVLSGTGGQDDAFGRIIASAVNINSRTGQLILIANNGSQNQALTVGHLGGIFIGAPTLSDMGVGTLNFASAAFANGLAYSVASSTGANLTNIRGISASSSKSNNLSGTCTFVAAMTCAVAFANNEVDSQYKILVGGIVVVSAKTVTGFTMTATGTNSNAVDWLLIR